MTKVDSKRNMRARRKMKLHAKKETTKKAFKRGKMISKSMQTKRTRDNAATTIMMPNLESPKQ